MDKQNIEIVSSEINKKPKKKGRLKKVLAGISAAIILISGGLFIAERVGKPTFSNILIRTLQISLAKQMGMEDANSYEPLNEPGRRTIASTNTLLVNDVNYAATYPNSFCDIYYPDNDDTVRRPTLFYFHGGGFLFGSKTGGDPLAVVQATEEDESYLTEYLKLGFNVISVEYAFAPAYTFPVQIIQVNEVLDFFLQHGDEYGIDMSQIVLRGGSAGADMVEMYGVAMQNAEYAEAMGLTPVVDETQVKAIVINEAALSPDVFEFRMNAMLRTWMGTHNLKSGKGALIDASKYITGKTVPMFIISSNDTNIFYQSSLDLEAALQAVGSDNEHYYCDPSIEILGHGFSDTFTTSPGARNCMDREEAFVMQYIK
ncbi:MAG: alpha/beta hydrolase [Eubacteriales bacterium]|nr:alpha/beta hydrolase [Eubacteriales bacterium]